jgi:hypothetical protein
VGASRAISNCGRRGMRAEGCAERRRKCSADCKATSRTIRRTSKNFIAEPVSEHGVARLEMRRGTAGSAGNGTGCGDQTPETGEVSLDRWG